VAGHSGNPTPLEIQAWVNDHVPTYGYRAFFNSLFETDFSNAAITNMTADQLSAAIESRQITPNNVFINTITSAWIICDEAHHLYAGDALNATGYSLMYLQRMWPTVHLVLLDATPLMTQPSEIVPLVQLLTRQTYLISDFFTSKGSTLALAPTYKQCLRGLQGRVFVVLGHGASGLPKGRFWGSPLTEPGLPPLNVHKCPHTPLQVKYLKGAPEPVLQIHIENCVIPLSRIDRNAPESHFAGMPDTLPTIDLAVLEGKGISLAEVLAGSGKCTKLVELLTKGGLLRGPGNVMIFTGFILYPCTILLEFVLNGLGLLHRVDVKKPPSPQAHSICLECGLKKNEHGAAHDFVPIYYIEINSRHTSQECGELLEAYNRPANATGLFAKLLIGGNAVTEAISVKNTTHLIYFDMPEGIPKMLQLMGRIMRPHIQSNLPPEVQCSNYHILHPVYANEDTPSYADRTMKQRASRWGIMAPLMVELYYACPYFNDVYYIFPAMPQISNGHPLAVPLMPFDSPKAYSFQSIQFYVSAISKFLSIKKTPNPMRQSVAPTTLNTYADQIAVCCLFIKSTCMILQPIGLQAVLDIAAKQDRFFGYNLSAIPPERIVEAASLYSRAHHTNRVHNLDTYLEGITTGAQYTQLQNHFLRSPIHPFVLSLQKELLYLYLTPKGIFYLYSINATGELMPYVGHAMATPQVPQHIVLQMTEITDLGHLGEAVRGHLHEKITNQQLLNILLTKVKVTDLRNYLLYGLLAKNAEVFAPIFPFIQFLVRMKILVTVPPNWPIPVVRAHDVYHAVVTYQKVCYISEPKGLTIIPREQWPDDIADFDPMLFIIESQLNDENFIVKQRIMRTVDTTDMRQRIRNRAFDNAYSITQLQSVAHEEVKDFFFYQMAALLHEGLARQASKMPTDPEAQALWKQETIDHYNYQTANNIVFPMLIASLTAQKARFAGYLAPYNTGPVNALLNEYAAIEADLATKTEAISAIFAQIMALETQLSEVVGAQNIKMVRLVSGINELDKCGFWDPNTAELMELPTVGGSIAVVGVVLFLFLALSIYIAWAWQQHFFRTLESGAKK
jgi:hypothetical protein